MSDKYPLTTSPYAIELAKEYSPAALREIRDHAALAAKWLRATGKGVDAAEASAFDSLRVGCDAVLEILNAK